jgi:hypothetical protein
MRQRFAWRGSLASLVACTVLPAPAAMAAPHHSRAAPGSIGIRLVDTSTGAPDNASAGPYILEQLAPGTTISRSVEITNGTPSAVAIAVYPAGAELRKGAFVFASGHTRNELSSWTSTGRDVLYLAPGAKALDALTIRVPSDASAEERFAVVWAELSGPTPSGGGVTLVNRVGVRMYVAIGPGGAAAANFSIGAPAAERSEAGEPVVVATIHNTGRRTIDIGGTLTLSNGPGGLRAGPYVVDPGKALAAGSVNRTKVRLDKQLPRGPWRAEIQLNSKFVQRTAVSTITFPAEAAAIAPAPDSSTRTRDRMLLGVLLSLLLLGGAALWFGRGIWRGGGGVGPAVTVGPRVR